MKGSNSRRARARVKERRHSPRLRVDPLVYLKIVPDNGGFLFDLGEGGMGVRVAKPLSEAAQIRFSFPIDGGRLVQGTGRICWLSDTGRSAGVRFVRFPDDSQSYIRQWLRSGTPQTPEDRLPPASAEVIPWSAGPQGAGPAHATQEDVARTRPPEAEADKASTQTSPVLQNELRKTPSSSTIFSPPTPRPDAMGLEPSAADPPVPESRLHLSMPQSQLLFLPSKSGQEDRSDSFGPAESSQYVYRPEEQPVSDRDREETTALQSAILSGSALEEEDDSRKKPRSGKIWVGAALGVALAALACLALLSRSYPGALAQFHGFVSAIQSQYAPGFAAKPFPTGRAERPAGRRRGRRSVRERTGSGTVFHVPSAGAAPSPTGAPELSQPSLLSGMPSVQSLALGQPAGIKVSVTSSAPHLHFGAMMPDLRNDGALVEEGAPVSIPLDMENQAAVPKPIVVEAVIGKDGGVKDLRLISSPDSRLAQAVVTAVRRWRYRPLYENGKPVEFTTRITFNFSMPHRNR